MRPSTEEIMPAGDAVLSPEANGQKPLAFRLAGSGKKTATALKDNCERMIAGNAPGRLVEVEYLHNGEPRTKKVWVAQGAENLNCTAFLTLTVGDMGEDGRFQQVWDAAEASRRINNLNRRVLKDLFEYAIVVTERHQNRAIHFHIVGILRGRPDIRTGFNFDAVRNRNYSSVSDTLRGLWARLREVLPNYGFGRAELTPIEKTGEAIAAYVSKYIEKNLFNRLKEDKGKKLVRYIGDWTVAKFVDGQLIAKGDGKLYKRRPNDFGWATPSGVAWRWKTREVAALIDVKTPEEAKIALGPRWAWNLSNMWKRNTDDPRRPKNWVEWSDEFTKENAEDLLSKWVSEEWALRRLYAHRLPDWDMDGYKLQRREEHEALIETDIWKKDFNRWLFLDASREVFKN
jgi:hypothetical protein